MTSLFIRLRLIVFYFIHYNVCLKNGQHFVVNVEKTGVFSKEKNGCSQRIEKQGFFTINQTQIEANCEKSYSMNAYYLLYIGS